jgi:MORN repeat
MAYDTLAHT